MSKPKYACPECGGVEFVSAPNSWDRYLADGDGLFWQATDGGDDELKLYCRECGERAPLNFEEAAR